MSDRTNATFAARPGVLWPLGGVLLVLVLQLLMVFERAINWDEFFHYSQIHQLANGTLASPLQTLHVRVFGWVAWLPGGSVDHIVAARLGMFACQLLTIAIVADMARRLSDDVTGVLCGLAYVSAGYVLQHGFSFRADPITAALLMGALWMILASRLDGKAIALTGLLLATAALFTIKVALYAPAFAGVAWLRWNSERRSGDLPVRLLAISGASAVFFAALYALHAQGVAVDPALAPASVLKTSADRMFSLGTQPLWNFALDLAAMSPTTVIVVLATPLLLLTSARPAAQKLCLLGLFLPLTSLLFYHNAAPYFYAFILPPVMVACCVVLKTSRGAALVAAALALNAVAVWAAEPSSPIDKQRRLIAEAQRMFPEPVRYFDFSAFLGAFPKANIFMTPWGIARYKAGEHPSMRATMQRTAVPLIIENDPMFTRALAGDEPAPEFLADDLAAIRATYLHFWGPYWLAGKKIPTGAGGHGFDLLVPGPYTLRGGALTIDGATHRDNDVIMLERGHHVVGGPRPAPVTLIWGKRIEPPAAPPPPPPYGTPF